MVRVLWSFAITEAPRPKSGRLKSDGRQITLSRPVPVSILLAARVESILSFAFSGEEARLSA